AQVGLAAAMATRKGKYRSMSSSAALEPGGSLFPEGAHAFSEVTGGAGAALQLTFETELRCEIVGAARAQGFLDHAEGGRRSVRQLPREIGGCSREVRVLEHLVDEAHLPGVVGR